MKTFAILTTAAGNAAMHNRNNEMDNKAEWYRPEDLIVAADYEEAMREAAVSGWRFGAPQRVFAGVRGIGPV